MNANENTSTADAYASLTVVPEGQDDSVIYRFDDLQPIPFASSVTGHENAPVTSGEEDALVEEKAIDAELQALSAQHPDAVAEVRVAQEDDLTQLPNDAHSVDLTRLSNNQNFKVRQKNPNATKKSKTRNAGFSGAFAPPAPNPPKSGVLLQSDKARNYLRQAMATPTSNKDGVDHINTSGSSQTRLGQALEINAHIPFHHPDLGPFKSVGGLWYFVGAEEPNETFRSLFGGECRMLGKNTRMRKIQGFQTIIAEATWIKIMSDEALKDAMRDSVLPFRCYYLQGELQLRVASLIEEWYMPILEEIRRTLKLGIGQAVQPFPDFSFLENTPHWEKKKHHARY